MTNIELQKILALLPPDLPVMFHNYEYDTYDVIDAARQVKLITVTRNGYSRPGGKWETYTELIDEDNYKDLKERTDQWAENAKTEDDKAGRIVSKEPYPIILIEW